MAEAIRFRHEVGLNEDVSWIDQVATDRTASSKQFGVALLPSELEELQGRALNVDAVVPVVEEYGSEHVGTFAGSYIDYDVGGTVVALFTAELPVHEAALRERLHPNARFAVRNARFTLEALEELHQRVLDLRNEFGEAGVAIGSIGVDVPANVLVVGLSGTDPGLLNGVAARLNAGAMVRLWWESADAIPRGSLQGRVADERGQPVPGLELHFIADAGGLEPDGGTAFGTGSQGEFEVPSIAAIGWRLDVIQFVPGQPDKVVGSKHITILPGKTTTVLIEVQMGA